MGEWQLSQSLSPGTTPIPRQLQADVLASFRRAVGVQDCGYKAWHCWALMNFRISMQLAEQSENASETLASSKKELRMHTVASVEGFVNAICLGTKAWCATVQQDLLNLLACLFKFHRVGEVSSTLRQNINRINLDAWLGVLPQLLARIHTMEPSIRSVLHHLLTRLGEKHPQALLYPLSVLLKSPVSERKRSAEALMKSLKNHSSGLVDEAMMVSGELIRVAISWFEKWQQSLEEASHIYCRNIPAMLDVLLPLHEEIENPVTQWDIQFVQTLGQDLRQAHEYLKEYISVAGRDGSLIDESNNERAEGAVYKAWSKYRPITHVACLTSLVMFQDLYYQVFRRINKYSPQMMKFSLTDLHPSLHGARNLELSVPGTYRVDGSYVKIEKFIPKVEVLQSKQHPRKLSIRGSDGNDYVFLLKGHEDLRQDERVMQLFGLVNALLERKPQTKKQDFQIQRYPITPLSHNCGVVGWVPNCDTLHKHITNYRKRKEIPPELEPLAMSKICKDHDRLIVMQKAEVFIEAMVKTAENGKDLKHTMWQKSTNSEEWLERRTKFTRSLAVMSMVGYILGLGDRHPANLMLDNLSGRVLHIDFGDCFENTINREAVR